MKRRKKQLHTHMTAAMIILAILILLAVFKTVGHKKTENTSENLQTEETGPDMEVSSAEETDDKTSENQLPEQEALSAEELAEAKKASFLPDYTSAPLLNTTAIKCLSMETGASETEVRFNWLSPSASAGQVLFTDTSTGETLTFQASCSASVTVPGYYVNKAAAAGLTPDTAYTYQVGNDDAWSPEYSYRTPAADTGSLTFLVTADAQIGQSDMEDPSQTAERWDSVLTRLLQEIPEASFLFHLGDQVADFGSQTHYEMFLEHLALYRIPLAPAVGNHDVANEYSIEENGHPGGPYFYEHFNVPNRSSSGQSQYDQDGNYYFVRGDVLFIVLNSSTSQGSDVQEQYVAQVVAEHPDTSWRILAQHYPAYPGAQKSHTDCKEYLARIADDNDIDLILGAHDHVYSRTAFVNRECETLNDYPYSSGSVVTDPEGTLYVTCSTSSGCLYHIPESEIRIVFQEQPDTPVALRFDVTESSLHMRAYLMDTWTVLDEYTIQKTAG